MFKYIQIVALKQLNRDPTPSNFSQIIKKKREQKQYIPSVKTMIISFYVHSEKNPEVWGGTGGRRDSLKVNKGWEEETEESRKKWKE